MDKWNVLIQKANKLNLFTRAFIFTISVFVFILIGREVLVPLHGSSKLYFCVFLDKEEEQEKGTR